MKLFVSDFIRSRGIAGFQLEWSCLDAQVTKIILPAIFSNHQSPSTRVKSKSFSLRIFLCVVPPKTALGYIFAGVSQKVEDVNRKVAHKRKFV